MWNVLDVHVCRVHQPAILRNSANITYIEWFGVFFAVCLCDAFILDCFEHLWHGCNESKSHTGVLIWLESHHLLSPGSNNTQMNCYDHQINSVIIVTSIRIKWKNRYDEKLISLMQEAMTELNRIYLHSINPSIGWHHRIWNKSSTNV
jgi:hypothetical protein